MKSLIERIKSKLSKSPYNGEKLSVIVNFYNMRRESKRTLFSLTEEYQYFVSSSQYEVIAIDNGSTEPLSSEEVSLFGDNFRYIFYDAKTPSPCAALNYAVSIAKYNNVMLCIDGARILSPSILHYTLNIASLYEHPFVYTLGMHIGDKPQNYLLKEGYDQNVEDHLLETIDWKKNGYELFLISSLALSAKKGFFSCLAESNCFMLKKADYLSIGGFDESFISRGGGISNLDIFERVISNSLFKRVMLLGEATFHQFHGGVATNVSMENHPLSEMMAEYKNINGHDFNFVFKMPDEYYGAYIDEYHEALLSVEKKD